MKLSRIVVHALMIAPAFLVLLGFSAFANNLFAMGCSQVIFGIVLGSLAGGLSVSLFAERLKRPYAP